jgi:isoleucyl-tRNA synthetase
MKPVKTDVHFPSLEEQILAWWQERGVIEKGLRANEGQEPFLFYDGPPFATGLPHYGHILAGTLKDIVPRYWVMKGKYVQRRWGWDCHGLPVEFEMENELGLSGLRDIEKYGVANFNEACRGIVQRYTKEWKQVITRTGRWADFDHGYRTMDPSFMETVWWVVKQLFDKGLVYEGYRVMPYSWRITTPLSNFEASLNYKEVQDPALTVRFKSLDHSRWLLAWTTTPWTLPSNLALAVHPEVEYVEIEDAKTKEHLVLSAARLPLYFSQPADYRVIGRFPGTQLEGERYEPLFPYFTGRAANGAFRVVLGEYVTTTDGTGIVHTAPAFGDEDFQVCQKYGIPLVDPVDAEGRFTDAVPEYRGQQVKEADKAIIRDLKARGAIYRHDTIVHNYPFCWRSDTPLIYKAISTWFVKLEPIKQTLLQNNQTTAWVPEHLRDGRFGNWLENARDWNISRNRFWGTPIPIWRGEDGELVCIGSLDELQKLSGQRPKDIHKHFVDGIEIRSPKTGKPMRRIPEVLDCWFESGSMPYAQEHYPFENKDRFEKTFPANFIAEGLDQTRGWFYTLSVLSAALFGRAPFRHVIVNGLVLAEDGKKMSKRLKNYPDPKYVLDTYGADALRAYLMSSPASHAEDLRFSEAGVKEIVRSVLLPFWNAYSFFVTYARADGWEPRQFQLAQLDRLDNELDRWLLSRLQSLIQNFDAKMEIYHLYEVVPEVLGFIDQLTNWYIRLNRRRFWDDEKNADKANAYATLYFTLGEFCKILAPILPFVTEAIYQNLCADLPGAAESVHLARFPQAKAQWRQPALEAEMALVESVIAMGRTCRDTHKLKNRQPLREIRIVTQHPEDKRVVEHYRELIGRELNVKKVSFSADESQLVTLVAKPNAKVLGPRLGAKMKAISAKVRELPPDQIAVLEKGGHIEVEGERLTQNDILIDRQPRVEGAIQTAGGITVWLDNQLDPALIDEGRAREFVNRVQKLRKDSGLEVTDRIRVRFDCPAELTRALQAHREYITSETLADALDHQSGGPWAADEEIDGLGVKLGLEKV